MIDTFSQQQQQQQSQSNQSNQSSSISSQKPEPGKALCRTGACRVCLKSFKPDDFSKICFECQQKVCEDCASYSKLDDNEDAVSIFVPHSQPAAQFNHLILLKWISFCATVIMALQYM